MKVQALSPAKINPFLAVGPPDSRGWHPLRTIFQAISLADRVTVEFGSSEPGVFSNWREMPLENTLTKTLRLASEAVELPPLRVEVEKVIPAQSGLGGGSSNAAALLRILSRWMPEAFPPPFQREMALAVGADVPFFLLGGRARGEGYGEVLTPLPDEPRKWMVAAKPPEGSSTPEAYRALDSRSREWRTWPDDEEPFNDFLAVASCGSQDLLERLMALGARPAGLTGSGSAVFGFVASEEEARLLAEALGSEGASFAQACHTLTKEESLWMS